MFAVEGWGDWGTLKVAPRLAPKGNLEPHQARPPLLHHARQLEIFFVVANFLLGVKPVFGGIAVRPQEATHGPVHNSRRLKTGTCYSRRRQCQRRAKKRTKKCLSTPLTSCAGLSLATRRLASTSSSACWHPAGAITNNLCLFAQNLFQTIRQTIMTHL